MARQAALSCHDRQGCPIGQGGLSAGERGRHPSGTDCVTPDLRWHDLCHMLTSIVTVSTLALRLLTGTTCATPSTDRTGVLLLRLTQHPLTFGKPRSVTRWCLSGHTPKRVVCTHLCLKRLSPWLLDPCSFRRIGTYQPRRAPFFRRVPDYPSPAHRLSPWRKSPSTTMRSAGVIVIK